MFKPFFQIKHLLAGHNVKVFPDNYTLYHDMQQRMVRIYRDHAEDVEVYSIDEAFLIIPDLDEDELLVRGKALRSRVLHFWTAVHTFEQLRDTHNDDSTGNLYILCLASGVE